jgi:geranylgeranyl diphosphate synthase type 3
MSWVDDPLAIGSSSSSIRHPALLEPYHYIADSGGKEVRTKLIEAFNIWLDVPESDLAIIRRVVRMLHNASLL